MEKRKYTQEIILHCAATPEGKDIKAETVKQWHIKDNKWQDCGYHFIIELDGTVKSMRDETLVGAHCKNHNHNSIGICYIGGCDKTGKKAKDTRTEVQKLSMYKLVKELMIKYHIDITSVKCHNDYDKGKACPSFDIYTFRSEFTTWLAGPQEKLKKTIKCPHCGMEINEELLRSI